MAWVTFSLSAASAVSRASLLLALARFSAQCEAPKIAKLVYNSNFTMVYGTYNELVTGAYKPTNITGGPHIASDNSKHNCTAASSALRSLSASRRDRAAFLAVSSRPITVCRRDCTDREGHGRLLHQPAVVFFNPSPRNYIIHVGSRFHLNF